MEKLEVTISVTKEFSNEDINDLVSTALEGGITYWCRKAVPMINIEDEMYIGVRAIDQLKVEFASDVISVGGSLKLYDAESSDIWVLNIENLLKGIKMYCEKHNVSPTTLMDDYDAWTADSIVQYALFNELVFG